MTDKYQRSLELYEKAKTFFPYGTQLFSRRPELAALGRAPIYFERAKNAHFRDVDGNEFIDMGMGVGPVSLGYCYEPVDRAAKAQIDKGVLGTVNNALEIEVAEMLTGMVPCAEMVKFCKGGGEADAIAVRIARGYTQKDVVLFCGYHGWHDWYISANLASDSTLNKHLMPGIKPKGVPGCLAGTCVPFEYNNLDSLSKTLAEHKDRVACIIMEPVRFKQPEPGFLEGVRELADRHGCLLIFDEVITGFRLSAGGAQEYYNVTPDLAAFAKAIANGYPLGAVVGRRDIMRSQADNFISSTYWSDTVSLAAGRATLNEIKTKPVIETLRNVGSKMTSVLRESAQRHGIKLEIKGRPAAFHIEFDYDNLTNKVMTLYIQEMAERGIYNTGVVYTCFTHTDDDISKIAQAVDETFGVLSKAVKDDNLDALLRCPERKTGFRRLV